MKTKLMQEIQSQPWAVLPETLRALYLAARSGSGVVQVDEPVSEAEKTAIEAAALRGGAARSAGTIAIIPVQGMIRQKKSIYEDMYGYSFGTTTEGLAQMYRRAIEDDAIKAIVLDVNSPGGTTAGVAELADEMFSLRGKKKTVAVANSLAASAAYHIASQADEVVGTPTSQTGSIGVFAMHEDISGMADQMGIKITFISAGKYKTEGNPFEPLSDSAKEAIQRQIDEHYGLFTAAVARGRGVSLADVKAGYGQGRVLTAKDAKAEGLIDRIGTMREVITKLGGALPGDRPGSDEGVFDERRRSEGDVPEIAGVVLDEQRRRKFELAKRA